MISLTGTNIDRARGCAVLDVVKDPKDYITRVPAKFNAIEPDEDFEKKNIVDILKKDKNVVYVRNGDDIQKDFFIADYELKISQYRSSENKITGHLLSREEAVIAWIRHDQPDYTNQQILELASLDPKCNKDTLKKLLDIKDVPEEPEHLDEIEKPEVIEEPIIEKPVVKKRSTKKPVVKKQTVVTEEPIAVSKEASDNTDLLNTLLTFIKSNTATPQHEEEPVVVDRQTKPVTISGISGTIRIPALDFVLDEAVAVIIQDGDSDFLYEPVRSEMPYTLACDSIKIKAVYSGISYTVPSTGDHHTIYLVEK